MAKYKRSIQGGAFRPETVSQAGEARLTEYADRIAKGLREERDAIISNRDRISDAMRANAEIESSQLQRDLKTSTGNIQIQIDEAQQLSQRAMDEFNTKTKANEQMYSTFASLSNKAAIKLQEIEVERLHKQWDNDFITTMQLGDNAPGVKALEALGKESTAKTVEGEAQLAEAQANGADPLEVSKLSAQLNSMSYGAKLANLTLIGRKYGSYLRERFLDSKVTYTDKDGNSFTGESAARNRDRTAIIAAKVMNDFMDLSEIRGMNPALLQKSGLIGTMLSENERVMKIAGEAEQIDLDAKADETLLSEWKAAGNDSQKVKELLERHWPGLVRRKGYEGALDWLTEKASTVTEPDAYEKPTPYYNLEGLASATFGINGETFGSRKQRMLAIQRSVRNAQTQAFQQSQQQKQILSIEQWEAKRAEIEENFRKFGADKDASYGATLIQGWKRIYGYVPPDMQDFVSSINTQNEQEDQRKLSLLSVQAQNGKLTQGAVNSIDSFALKAQAQQLLIQQNKVNLYGENYERTIKGIEKDARGLTQDAPVGSASSISGSLSEWMKLKYSEQFQKFLAQTKNKDQAAVEADKWHQKQLALARSGDKTSAYHLTTAKGGAVSITALDEFNKNRASLVRSNLEHIRQVAEDQGSAILKDRSLVPPTTLRRISQTFYAGGNIQVLMTPEIEELARILQLKNTEVVNKLIDTYNYGAPAGDKIEQMKVPDGPPVTDYQDPDALNLINTLPTLRSVQRFTIQQTSGDLSAYNRTRIQIGDTVPPAGIEVGKPVEIQVGPTMPFTFNPIPTGNTLTERMNNAFSKQGANFTPEYLEKLMSDVKAKNPDLANQPDILEQMLMLKISEEIFGTNPPR